MLLTIFSGVLLVLLQMDMWALGVCVYMWAYGKLPFTGAAPFVIYEKIRSQDVRLPPREDVSRASKIGGFWNAGVKQNIVVCTHPAYLVDQQSHHAVACLVTTWVED